MKRLALLVTLIGALMPSVLVAALPPTAYQTARVSAPNHVQIEITTVTPPRAGQSECVILGRIVTVFKGTVRVNQNVTLRKSCIGPAIGQTGSAAVLPPGPQIYVQTADLQRARFLEAFLSNAPVDIVSDQAVIIPSPSQTPRCNPASLGPICVPNRNVWG
jgi:hypothetical protein